jgi:hypothetical protein
MKKPVKSELVHFLLPNIRFYDLHVSENWRSVVNLYFIIIYHFINLKVMSTI